MPSFEHQLLPRLELERKDTKEGRFYFTPAGLFPSVTTVIDHLKDKTYLDLWQLKVGAIEANRIRQNAINRGNEIHRICENYLLNLCMPAPGVSPSFEQVKPLLDKNIEMVYGVELKVWSLTLKTAGTTDAVVKWNGENTILDFKTSRNPIDPQSDKIRLYKLQTVIYSLLVEEQYGMDIPWCCIVVIVPNEPPSVVRFKNAPYKEVAKEIFLKITT